MKLLISLIFAGTALSVAATHYPSGTHGKPHAASLHQAGPVPSAIPRGTLVALQQGKVPKVVIRRGRGGHLTTVSIAGHARLVSADGQALRVRSLRKGDQVAVPGSNRIVDLSQRTVDIRGLVAFAPESSGASMLLTPQHSEGIVVDLDSGTRYIDPSHQTTTPVQAEDGDLLDVRGVLDSALGEITQTETITRIVPLHHHAARPGKR